MTIQQALRKARKLWGKKACVECQPQGAFITQDGKWRENLALVCEHGKISDNRKCERKFYIIEREPELKLGRPKNHVAKYQVGRVMMGLFFEILGQGESFEKAFEQAEKNPPLVLG